MRRLTHVLIVLYGVACMGLADAGHSQTRAGAQAPLLLPPVTRSLDERLIQIRKDNADKPEEAVLRFTELLQIAERERNAGDQIVILTARAQHQARAKRLDDALQDLDRAIGISGAYPLPFFLRASYRAQRGDQAKALADLDKTIEVEPKFTAVYPLRARLRADLRRWADAAADYGRVLAGRNDDRETRHLRAVALSAAGDKKGALADLDLLLAKAPDDVDLLLDKAIVLRGLGEFDAALQAVDRAVAGGDKRGYGSKERGMILFARGDFTAAEQAFRESFDLGLGSGLPQPYTPVYLEAARLRLGRSNVADLNRRQALAFTTAWSGAIAEYLAGTLTAEGLIAKAKENVTREWQAEERLCEAQFFIAQRQLGRGATEEAVRALQAALATGAAWFNEHGLARQELIRLGRL